jgi:hypothetical protein
MGVRRAGGEDRRAGAFLGNLQVSLARGDIDAVRRLVLTAAEAERERLAIELGPEILDQAVRAAARTRRPRKRGRVIVLHGILGSMLDVVDRRGDADRVWVNLYRLFQGRIEDLELDAEGKPSREGVRVRLAGVHRSTYLALILDLDREWDVRPFDYDWREDIDRSADRLAGEIRASAPAAPAHIVAHSMGGLVARRFAQRHPDLWASMRDAANLEAGGRLILLGTPNHGSFAIPLALSGAEKAVRGLERLDFRHDLRQLLQILNSFPGSYQMLPSPLIRLGDHHGRLFRPRAWGKWPVRGQLLERAEAFIRELHEAVDPRRFVCIAGTGRETPDRVRIDSPGAFRFQTTTDGDGRVPHVLGLLRDVPSFWVDEGHGDLPRNERVRAALHDLLSEGTTDLLDPQPARRPEAPARTWRRAGQIDALPDELDRVIAAAPRRRGAPLPALSPAEEADVERLVLGDYLGGPTRAPASRAERTPEGRGRRRPVVLETLWGDITQVRADVYVVGHYQGVPPQYAELALDRAISGGAGDLVITGHARRGSLRGALGEVQFFPWGRGRPRIVAVAGMGHPGAFTVRSLRRLIRDLAASVGSLPHVRTVATVLIGSGAGTLGVAEAVRGLLEGLAEGLHSEHAARIRTIRIVELYRDRAAGILRELKRATKAAPPGGRRPVEVRPTLAKGPGGRAATRAPAAARRATRPPEGVAARLSVFERDGVVHAAAITHAATVPERVVSVDLNLIEEVAGRVNDPERDLMTNAPSFLARLLVPREFRDLLREPTPLVIEVDRVTAQLPWELVSSDVESRPAGEPIGVRAPLARQMRTIYSPAPQRDTPRPEGLRALVVGDPGDPAEGDALEGAREEALRVLEILRAHGLEVTAFIGAPGSPRRGIPRGVRVASRADVLNELMHGDHDILHYAGHGDFDPANPSRVGWVFDKGLLTAREIGALDQVPPLVVANACLSARTSRALAGRRDFRTARSETGLLPSLADEFFHLGVRHYVGTAWAVNDVGAVLFAETFYRHLLGTGEPGGRRTTVGDAVQEARVSLYRRRREFDRLWAAYQHYGDPTSDAASWRATARARPGKGTIERAAG